MASFDRAKQALKPFLEGHTKALNERKCDTASRYYDYNAVLIRPGKKCIYTREAIKRELILLDKIMGAANTELTEEKYQMTDDYIFLSGEYTTTTEKMGTLEGRFTQIWKKVENGYVIIYSKVREI